jgi:DNA polymerase III alpha subunit
MKYNEYGQVFTTEQELCNLLYKNPNLDLTKFLVEDPQTFNQSLDLLHYSHDKLKTYDAPNLDLAEFDRLQQQQWHMPQEYQKMDIAKWLLDQCHSQTELQRVGEELLLYQERNLFPLLQYMKYLVDTMRKNRVVWGVGRGSSVASYVLYLIGIHKINSIRYELDIKEFLK